MRKRILLIGDVVGAYRSQNLIKILLDHKYMVGFATRRYYCSSTKKRSPLVISLRKVIDFIARILLVIEVILKAPFADILYLLPMNHTLIPLAYLAKLIFRKPLIAELYISAYDTARDRGWFRNSSLLKVNCYQFLDRMIIERPDIVIHLSRSEFDYIVDLVGARVDPERVRILPLAVDPKSTASPTPSRIFRICWWGTFIPLHGLEQIIAAARLLVDSGVTVRFDLLGLPGHDASKYSKLLIKLDLESYVKLHTDKSFANGQLEPFLQQSCDLALGSFGKSEKARNVIVNKIVDAFAMRLPVLTMDSPALSEFIDTENELFVCSNAPEDIAQSIKAIRKQPKERHRRAVAGYRRYQNTFSVERYSIGIREAIVSVTWDSFKEMDVRDEQTEHTSVGGKSTQQNTQTR